PRRRLRLRLRRQAHRRLLPRDGAGHRGGAGVLRHRPVCRARVTRRIWPRPAPSAVSWTPHEGRSPHHLHAFYIAPSPERVAVLVVKGPRPAGGCVAWFGYGMPMRYFSEHTCANVTRHLV